MGRAFVFLLVISAIFCGSGCAGPGGVFDPNEESIRNLPEYDPEHPEQGGVI